MAAKKEKKETAVKKETTAQKAVESQVFISEADQYL